jgi:hypothetical protein
MELFKAKLIACFLIIGLYLTPLGHAHTPLIACSDNGDGTVTCKGGFSDGSSASGVELRVERDNGKVLIKGEMSEDSQYTLVDPDL